MPDVTTRPPKIDATPQHDVDTATWREYITRKIREEAEWRETHREAIIMNQTDAAHFFWEGQTAEEVLRMKQWLVRTNRANWAVWPRDDNGRPGVERPNV